MPSNFFYFQEKTEPYRSILSHYRADGIDRLTPRDSETKLLLKDLPLITRPNEYESDALSADRTVFLTDDGALLVQGVSTQEQAAVYRDVARFALFVHFFSEMFGKIRAETLTLKERTLTRTLLAAIPALPPAPHLMVGPFSDPTMAHRAVAEAGAALVSAGLVDSIFGNVSCRVGETILISRSGAPLDRLDGGTVICPLCESCGTARCASSEYPSHRRIVLESSYYTVLHGHPVWTVIHSLATNATTLFGLPVVEGDPGIDLAGPLPPAVMEQGAAIVRGHGLFAAGQYDFRAPFDTIYRTEAAAFKAYLAELF